MPFTTATEYQGLPDWVQKPLKESVSEAHGYAKEPYKPYPSPRLAEIPDDIKLSHENGRKNLNSYLPFLMEAESMARKGQEPFSMHVEEYMNPYRKNVTDQIASEGNRNFIENILPALEGKFVRLGQHGGSRHANMSLRAARDLQKEILDRQTQSLATGYQQAGQMYNADRAKQLEAASQLGNIGTLQQAGMLSDMAMLENQGRYQQQQKQAGLDIDYQDFLRQMEHPMQRLTYLQSILQGLPTQNLGMHQSFYQTPATPQMNVLGQLGTLAGNIWGSRMMRG